MLWPSMIELLDFADIVDPQNSAHTNNLTEQTHKENPEVEIHIS